MTPSKLFANRGEKITFTTHIIGTMTKTPLIQIQNFGDETSQKIHEIKQSNIFTHNYQLTNSIQPQSTMYIDQCTYLKNQASIAINTTDSCLLAKAQGTLKTTYKCDLDGDGIPDLCDTDIDGDGIANLLGIINYENKDCSFRGTTTN